MPILELESKFRSALRAAAHPLRPVVQIGDKGLSDAVIQEIDRALAAHGLIKVRAGGEDRPAREAVQASICEALDCAPVHLLGKVLVLYRPTESDPSAQKLLGDKAPRGVATLGLQPRKAEEPHVPKKLAAEGKPAPARRRNQRTEREEAPLTARERYLGAGTRTSKPAARGEGSRGETGSRFGTPTRPARAGSALSLRAGARGGAGRSAARPAGGAARRSTKK